jgi:hypothetical protein
VKSGIQPEFKDEQLEKSLKPLPVYVEIGNKRTFACAVDWPGWCRNGRDEKLALQTLLEYGPRYARVLGRAGLGFQEPAGESSIALVGRLRGNATTDFGAPDITPPADDLRVNSTDLERFKTILIACWSAFDAAVNNATGKQLRSGPRGGGRTLDRIVQHLLGADAAYLSRISWKLDQSEPASSNEAIIHMREAVLNALVAKTDREMPKYGPHGGKLWTLRFFVRRLAWHVLDHTWEIEDRIA